MADNTCKWEPKYLPEYKCHEPPLSGDPNGYCILHSEKDDKDIAEFTKKVDERMAAPGRIDLVGCYFPGTFRSDYFSRCKFDKPVNFSEATFSQAADFSTATFSQEADFSKATFSQEAYFSSVTFHQEVKFGSGVLFSKTTDFSKTTFGGKADFWGAFKQDVNFSKAKFQEVSFSGTNFCKSADFSKACFERNADFRGVIFNKENETSEKLEKLPEGIQFPGGLEEKIHYDSSNKLLVWQGVMTGKDREKLLKLSTDEQYREAIGRLFQRSQNTKETKFNSVVFHDEANFSGVCCKKTEMDFTNTVFKGRTLFMPYLGSGVDFGLVLFNTVSFLGEVIFQNVDLSQCTFLHSNIDKVDFRHCNFGNKDEWLLGIIPHHRQNVLKDERDCDESTRKKSREEKYEPVRRLYLELKKNFEEKKDWNAAGDFHYGEMECRRKMMWWPCRWLFSLEAVYFWLSGYGERPLRVGLWVLALIFGLAFLHPLPEKQVTDKPLLPQAVSEVRERLDRTRETLDKILPHLLSKLKEKEVEPEVKLPEEVVAERPVSLYEEYTTRLREIWNSQWARNYREKFKSSLRATVRLDTGEEGWVSTIQGILGPILIALFALALRRKVKR